VWFVVGVQEQSSAEWAAALLLDEQSQGGAVQSGWASAASLCPVLGQCRVVGGGVGVDQGVPDDLCPGELGQVGAAVAVAENPVVLQ
jgi:hypothetical protein